MSCFQKRNPNFRYPRWSSEIIAIFFYNQIWQYILTIFRYCIYVEFLRKSIEWCVFERVNYYTAVVVCAQNWQIWRLESWWKKLYSLHRIVKLSISRNCIQLLLSKASTRSWVWVSISLNSTQHDNTQLEWTKRISPLLYKILPISKVKKSIYVIFFWHRFLVVA